MTKLVRSIVCIVIGCAVFGRPLYSQMESSVHHLNVRPGDMKWRSLRSIL